MSRLMMTAAVAATFSFFAAASAEAQLLGQGSGYGPVRNSHVGGLPLGDSYGHRGRTRTTRRRTNTGGNWVNRGYVAPTRRQPTYRPQPQVRTWQIYTTTFTYQDAVNVYHALRRSGYYVQPPRARTIAYRPYARTVFDVYYLR